MVVGIFRIINWVGSSDLPSLGVADADPPLPMYFLCESNGHYVISSIINCKEPLPAPEVVFFAILRLSFVCRSSILRSSFVCPGIDQYA